MLRHWYRFIICCLFFGLGIGISVAATVNTDSSSIGIAQHRITSIQTAFEGPIDPMIYRIGPGDELAVFVQGVLESSFPVYVGPEGKAYVPASGELAVSGLTLKQTQDLIAEAVKPKYPAASVIVRLTRPRMFRVSLVGSVNNPGRYVASGLTRASDLIELAGGATFTDQPKDTTPDGRPITIPLRTAPLRGLWLIHQTGDTSVVDLESFYQCGRSTANPFLRDGDIFIVPFWSNLKGVLRITGAIRQPQVVRYMSNDHLRTILLLSGGLAPTAKGVIELYRVKNSGERSLTTFDSAWIASSDEGPALLPDDQIFVPHRTELAVRSTVTVLGEVAFPGDYPVDEKTIRVADVLKAAGGLTTKAKAEEVSVVRRTLLSIPDPEFNRLYGLKRDEMSWTENEYMKAKRRDLEPRIVLDLAKFVENGDVNFVGNVVLQDGDIIRVPRTQVTIKVLGQVVRPGLVVFTPGKNYKYYIENTGGYTSKAKTSEIRIIKASTGQWLKASSSIEIDVGDTIFIPETADTDWWTTYKDSMTILSQIATLVLAFVTVSKL